MGLQEEQTTLIDFLYKDTSRTASFFAQLFEGNLREIAVAAQSSSIKSWQAGGKIPVIAEGNVGSEQSNTEALTKTVDPHDQNVLSLLHALQSAKVPNHIPKGAVGQIVLLEGQILVRNYEMLSKSLPIFFSLEGNHGIPKTDKKDQKFITSLLKLIPMGLELELVTSYGQTLIGTIKPEYLVETPDDISRIHGSQLPGFWHVLGIVDTLGWAKLKGTNEIRQALDEFSEGVRTVYSHSQAAYTIAPILIYRELIT